MATIVIRRYVTVLLLLIATAAILSVTLWSSGKSYTKVEPLPFDELRHIVHLSERKPVSTQVVALIVMPIVGNILLFLPWGFFMFLALYTVDRPTVQTYVLTILLGFTFTLGIEAWQYFLPSRVADISDVICNTLGAIMGAILGHMRLRVRFEFD